MVTARITHTVASVPVTYICDHCGFECPAQVEAHGMGASAPLLHSARVGEQRAMQSAERTAHDTLLFVPCPRCGRKSSDGPALVMKIYAQMLVALPLVTVLAAVVFASVKGMEGPELTLIVGITASLSFLAGLFALWTSPRPWSDAEERTTFCDDR